MVNLNVNTYWKTPRSSLARARIRHSVVFRNRLTAALIEQWLLEKVPTFLSEKEFTSQGEVILDRSRSFSLSTSQSDLIHHKQIHIWSTPRRVSCCVTVLGKCLAAARKTFATFATWVRLLNFSWRGKESINFHYVQFSSPSWVKVFSDRIILINWVRNTHFRACHKLRRNIAYL